ncbi:hypothetical protein [Deinococcus petrolearius]|uniref:Uncharacterized protein n=1 Tax=Deinococcus petrolearius TaxID=1751295 RepID=A0ABW1DDI9_9DEIO
MPRLRAGRLRRRPGELLGEVALMGVRTYATPSGRPPLELSARAVRYVAETHPAPEAGAWVRLDAGAGVCHWTPDTLSTACGLPVLSLLGEPELEVLDAHSPPCCPACARASEGGS